jgi:hypothetical protein
MIEERDALDDELEPDLAHRFAELRDGRERRARSFSLGVAVARGRARNRARRAWLRKRLGVALATTAPLLTVLIVQLREQAEEREAIEAARQAATILEWQSPTAPLMHNAYAAWLGAVPSLSASVIDTTSMPTGGSQ